MKQYKQKNCAKSEDKKTAYHSCNLQIPGNLFHLQGLKISEYLLQIDVSSHVPSQKKQKRLRDVNERIRNLILLVQ